jgi:hypothetical protein
MYELSGILPTSSYLFCSEKLHSLSYYVMMSFCLNCIMFRRYQLSFLAQRLEIQKPFVIFLSASTQTLAHCLKMDIKHFTPFLIH